MEIQQLRYFLAAANCSNFSRAAKQCFTSRQNIAHAMNVLERELGIALFERKGNGVELTPAGQQVACHADDIVSRVDSLQALFATTSSAGEGLSIAVTYNLLSKIPEETESFIFKFDRWINLFEMGCEDCYRAVCSGEADVGLALCMRRSFDDCNFEEIGHLKAYAIVNEHSPLAQKPQLSIFDLRTQRLQIMSESAFQYEPLFAQLNALGYDFSNISVATTSSTLYGIKRNEAVGIATSVFVESLPAGMRALPLDDPRYDWCIYVLYPPQSKHQATVMRFIQGLKKSYSCA